jgi:hypothetical protein
VLGCYLSGGWQPLHAAISPATIGVSFVAASAACLILHTTHISVFVPTAVQSTTNPSVQALTYRLAEGNKMEEVEEKDRLYLSDAYKLTVLQAMSVPQLIDTILINPTVNISPSYRDTGEAGGVCREVVCGRFVVGNRVLWLGGCLVGGCLAGVGGRMIAGCLGSACWLGAGSVDATGQWLHVAQQGLWPEAGNPYQASLLARSLYRFIVPCRGPLA